MQIRMNKCSVQNTVKLEINVGGFDYKQQSGTWLRTSCEKHTLDCT